MKKLIFILTIGALLYSCSEKQEIIRIVDFNSDWKFIRQDVSEGQKPEFDDSAWRSVHLPHDYSIEDLPAHLQGLSENSDDEVGPFSRASQGKASTGHVLGGTAWYRKHFILNEEDAQKRIKILFDGIYMNADVWINGHHLGNHPYGYTAFFYDLTPHLKPAGEENVLAIQVKNEGENSRWYSGSGIYRNVKLIKTGEVFIDVWGNHIMSSEVSEKSAVIEIATEIVNSLAQDTEAKVHAEVKDSKGQVVGQVETKVKLSANAKSNTQNNIQIANPNLWSIDDPALYELKVSVFVDGKLTDQTVQKTGIRSIAFSTEKGFELNGEQILLKGACMHHDNGMLGSAAFDRAEYRRVRIMKENGYNAIRTAHNPPSTAFLDACDELGIVVIDESFDQWQRPKNAQDYNLYFDDWWEKDMESMLLRDRNHPSIIMWSFGNEINERVDSSGLIIAQKLINKIHDIGSGIPATQAICRFWDFPGRPWTDTAPAFKLLDVQGYNYAWRQYESDFKGNPSSIMYASESVVSETFENWQKVKELPYVIGDFVWTGMDYFGESGLGRSVYDARDSIGWMGTGEWPWYNAYCGDIDVLGNKKPQKIYKDVVWENSHLELVVHQPIPSGVIEHTSYWGWPNLLPSWTWDGHEGEALQVLVYSNYDQVRLELNGEKIGTKDVSDATRLTAEFEVPYEAGELVAVGLEDGEEVERKSLKTTGKPYQLRLTAERSIISADHGDLAYFNVEVLDEQGILVPEAEVPVTFTIEGECQLQAIGNGNPTDMKSFQQSRVTTFRGRCQLIIRSTGHPGSIIVKVVSEGLIEGNAEVGI